MTDSHTEDLEAIGLVLDDLYESISGSDDSERDWDLCLSLFHPDARVSPNVLEDRARSVITEEEFQADARPRIAPLAFYEWEVERDIEITGDVASARSRYQAAETPRGQPIIKEGVNHLLLIRDQGRWVIMAIAW